MTSETQRREDCRSCSCARALAFRYGKPYHCGVCQIDWAWREGTDPMFYGVYLHLSATAADVLLVDIRDARMEIRETCKAGSKPDTASARPRKVSRPGVMRPMESVRAGFPEYHEDPE